MNGLMIIGIISICLLILFICNDNIYLYFIRTIIDKIEKDKVFKRSRFRWIGIHAIIHSIIDRFVPIILIGITIGILIFIAFKSIG